MEQETEGESRTVARLRVLNSETKQAKAANEVLAEFASVTDELTKEVEHMSAFFVICFDDHGNPVSRLHVGEMFPMPTPLIPMVAKECATATVYSRE